MLTFSCPCEQVALRIDRRPDFIHECNCSLCSRSAARWGYFHPSEVTVTGETQGYSRPDRDAPAADVRSCITCGTTTHFRLTPSAVARFGDSQMGVNMALADETDLAGIELRYPDGRAWPGEGAFDYVRPPRVIGAASPSE